MRFQDQQFIEDLCADRWWEEDVAAEEDQWLSRQIARDHFGDRAYERLTGRTSRPNVARRLAPGPLLPIKLK